MSKGGGEGGLLFRMWLRDEAERRQEGEAERQGEQCGGCGLGGRMLRGTAA